MEDRPDDADRAEEVAPAAGSPGAETPEADALEQATPAVPVEDDDRVDGIGDAPEADALEQRRGVGGDDEGEDRR
jgi:hypothetical protein